MTVERTVRGNAIGYIARLLLVETNRECSKTSL